MIHSFRLFKELIFRLTDKEIFLLKKKFEVGIKSTDKNKNKSKELLKLVLKNPEITKVEVERKLYDDSSKAAFNKLIDRAIEKIDEILITFSRDVTTVYSERNFAYFHLKRRFLIIQMRLLRGIEFDFRNQLEKIITSANRFEHYDIMVEALSAKQRHEVLRNKKAVSQIQKLIDRYEGIKVKLQNARNIWSRFGVLISNVSYATNYKKELSEVCKILRDDFEQTASKNIGYIYYFLEVESRQIVGNYKEAEVFLKKLYSLLQNNESIYTKTKHAEVALNLAANKIFLRDFSSAVIYAKEAKRHFTADSINYYVATGDEFLARYYNGEFLIAEGLIGEIYNFCRTNGGPFLHSKYAYQFACIKTILGEIEKSNDLLVEVKELEKEKGIWNLGKRMLAIINGIESKDYESVELKVLSLEKFLKRISKSNQVRKRDKVILRILLKLINEGYDFNKVYNQKKEYFDFLEGNDPEYSWKIKSPELIIFPDWFKKKMHENSKAGIAKLTLSH
jgi:hypothetical protein